MAGVPDEAPTAGETAVGAASGETAADTLIAGAPRVGASPLDRDAADGRRADVPSGDGHRVDRIAPEDIPSEELGPDRVADCLDPAFRTAAGAAAVVDLDELCGSGTVLLLAPHPDDETLGCGAAIAAATGAGRQVQVVLVTDGSRSHPASRRYPAAALAALRAAELDAALALLTGGRGPAPVRLGYPDQGAPEGAALERAADALAARAQAMGATALWATWGGDPHSDHVATAALAAAIGARMPELRRWSYPVWGRFRPRLPLPSKGALRRFDAAPWRGLKTRALACHRSQMTAMIADDPEGFVMEPAHQAHFLAYPEIFIREG